MSEVATTGLDALEYPDLDASRRLASLVGIDDFKERLAKSLRLILDPTVLDSWVARNGPTGHVLAQRFRGRQPLFLLGGDVGTGKTALAESIGDRVARESSMPITLFRMSLASRGSGLVGEMTRLISDVFAYVESAANARRGRNERALGGVLLFIDEADALAQSREAAQMHHEDRAGVNALIRGIDDLTRARLPVAVLMATNRLTALDPAIRRRAADLFVFERPNAEQRRLVLTEALGDLLSKAQLDVLVKRTGSSDGSAVGFTYSDLTQRFLPAIVLAAVPDLSIDDALILRVLQDIRATPPFHDTETA